MLTGEADVVAEDAAGDGGDEAGEDDDAGDLARVRLVPRGVVHDHGSRHCARPRRRNQTGQPAGRSTTVSAGQEVWAPPVGPCARGGGKKKKKNASGRERRALKPVKGRPGEWCGGPVLNRRTRAGRRVLSPFRDARLHGFKISHGFQASNLGHRGFQF